MKINTKLADAQWYDIDDIQVQLRPYPASLIIPTDDPELTAEQMLRMYNYCVVDWRGLTDEHDKPLECNDTNKKYIYDYIINLRDKILDKITNLFEVDEKN